MSTQSIAKQDVAEPYIEEVTTTTTKVSKKQLEELKKHLQAQLDSLNSQMAGVDEKLATFDSVSKIEVNNEVINA